MKVLVANLGSTSFKYRLYDMTDERQLARGGVERIGSPLSRCFVEVNGNRREEQLAVPDHAVALQWSLDRLTEPGFGCLKDAREVAAVGFKAVHAGLLTGVRLVDDNVLAAMEELNEVAPAHNPPYVRAMRILREKLPQIPLVAAFETDFHQTVPEHHRLYGVPYEWATQWGVRRYGFHGASHRYIAQRTLEIVGPKARRIISCHLGGSSSLCAIRDGKSVFTSMGMSPQSGLPQNNRVGDFDVYALPVVLKRSGKTLEEILQIMATQGGLLGVSGVSGDIRDLVAAAQAGNQRAKLALDFFAAEVRRYLGACLVELGGADVLVFTGGIGENQPAFREMVVSGLEELGFVLDRQANQQAKGEAPIHAPESRVHIWVIPTNEELIVARLTKKLLEG
ncbi:MAG: acetate/propionate family kinase [Thermoguttaceae bacterium]|nr:acetate/propionate family kinase [Thermoguttaceae bacterium]MDW8077377.1 acetate/propionate family kinase [Thermoguttaceae bacterium]